MVAKTHVALDNGTFKTVRKMYVNDGSFWRTVRVQWIRDDAGTWRKVFTGAFIYDETISVNTSNYDLRTKLTNAGWNETDDVQATITINPAITVYSTTTPTAAFTISPALPAGSTVTLTNKGTIVGKAGNGGDSDAVGSPGGTALFVASPIVINNTGGTIAGGGGGGGGGGSASVTGKNVVSQSTGGGGGGGGGTPLSTGAGGVAAAASFAPGQGSNGSAGTTTGGAFGAGASHSTPFPVSTTSGRGGNGGNRGSGGATSVAGTATAPIPSGYATPVGPARAGGSAGAAISGNPLVTLPTPQLGTVTGPRV